MDIDRIYQLMGSAVKRLFGFYIKRPIQRYNVDNRAEKVLEKQKTIPLVAPRHERTDQLFKQITANNPQFKEELNAKREDLLKRMQKFQIVSKERQFTDEEIHEMEEIRQRVISRLPQSRHGTDIPLHAYTEPAVVPIGRVSLVRALDFIAKNSNNPEEYDSKTIAKQTHLGDEDVKNVIRHFRPFHREELSEDEKVEDRAELFGLSKEKAKEFTNFLKPKSTLERQQIETPSPQTPADKR